DGSLGEAAQQRQADRRPPDPLAGGRDGDALQVVTGRVDARRVADRELQVDGRGDPYELGDLVVADRAAEVVRALDVDVQGSVDRLPDGGDLRQGEVRGQVDGGDAEVLQQPRRRRVGGGEGDRGLELQVRGQVAGALQLAEHPEVADVADEHTADPEFAAAN